MIKRAGYDVIEAMNADAAIAILKNGRDIGGRFLRNVKP
jgi:hypothetical protein